MGRKQTGKATYQRAVSNILIYVVANNLGKLKRAPQKVSPGHHFRQLLWLFFYNSVSVVIFPGQVRSCNHDKDNFPYKRFRFLPITRHRIPPVSPAAREFQRDTESQSATLRPFRQPTRRGGQDCILDRYNLPLLDQLPEPLCSYGTVVLKDNIGEKNENNRPCRRHERGILSRLLPPYYKRDDHGEARRPAFPDHNDPCDSGGGIRPGRGFRLCYGKFTLKNPRVSRHVFAPLPFSFRSPQSHVLHDLCGPFCRLADRQIGKRSLPPQDQSADISCIFAMMHR